MDRWAQQSRHRDPAAEAGPDDGAGRSCGVAELIDHHRCGHPSVGDHRKGLAGVVIEKRQDLGVGAIAQTPVGHVGLPHLVGQRRLEPHIGTLGALLGLRGHQPGPDLEIDGNTQAAHQTPMFGRGRIDHIGLHAANLEAFSAIRDRLITVGAADRVVTVFGRKLSLFFRDPDQMEGEVLVANPDADTDNLRYGPSPRFS